MPDKPTIDNEQQLRDFLKNSKKAVILFGKPDCLHCSIVETVIEGIAKEYPLIDFGFTTEKALADARHIEAFPMVAFYENGNIMGTLHGSGKITLIKEMLNIWFKKD